MTALRRQRPGLHRMILSKRNKETNKERNKQRKKEKETETMAG